MARKAMAQTTHASKMTGFSAARPKPLLPVSNATNVAIASNGIRLVSNMPSQNLARLMRPLKDHNSDSPRMYPSGNPRVRRRPLRLEIIAWPERPAASSRAQDDPRSESDTASADQRQVRQEPDRRARP